MGKGFKIHQCLGPTPDQLDQNLCVQPGLYWAEGSEKVVSLWKSGDIQVSSRFFLRYSEGPICGPYVLSRERRGWKPDLCCHGRS